MGNPLDSLDVCHALGLNKNKGKLTVVFGCDDVKEDRAFVIVFNKFNNEGKLTIVFGCNDVKEDGVFVIVFNKFNLLGDVLGSRADAAK